MPRIPVLDSRSVQPQLQQSSQPFLRQPDYSGARTAQALTQDIAAAGQGMAQGYADSLKAADEARAVTEADAMLEQGNRFNDAFAQLRKSQGLAATEARASVIEKLDKDRQELAASLTDVQARQRFLVRSAQQLAAYRVQVEHYVSGEFDAAREATSKARQAQVLSATEAGVPNFEAWQQMSRAAEEDIRATAPSPEAGEASVQAFRSANGEAFARSLIAQGRLEEAEKYTRENQATLGGRFVETSTAVAQAKKGAERELAKAQAVRDVAGVLEKSKEPDGYVDEGKAIAAFNELDVEAQVNAAPQLRRALTAEVQRKKADVDGWRKAASGQFNAAGFAGIDGQLVEKLNTYDPDYLRRLRSEDELRQRRARARAKGLGGGKADRANDKLWLTRFKALGSSGMAEADVEDFVLGHGVTEQGVADMQLAQSRAKEHIGSGIGRASDDMANDVERYARSLRVSDGRRRAPELSEEEVTEVRSQAVDRFDAFVAKEKRAPNQRERDDIRDDILHHVVRRTPRSFGPIPLPDKVETKRAFQVPEEVAPGPVQMKFPNDQTYPVPADQIEKAKKKGGVIVNG